MPEWSKGGDSKSLGNPVAGSNPAGSINPNRQADMSKKLDIPHNTMIRPETYWGQERYEAWYQWWRSYYRRAHKRGPSLHTPYTNQDTVADDAWEAFLKFRARVDKVWPPPVGSRRGSLRRSCDWRPHA